MLDFGELLRKLREAAELTQEQLGDRLHMSKSMIYYYEHSRRDPSAEVLMQLAEIFHVSVDYLLGREKKKQTIDLSGLPDKDIEFVQDVVSFLRRKNDEQGQGKKEPEQKKNEKQDNDTTANCP